VVLHLQVVLRLLLVVLQMVPLQVLVLLVAIRMVSLVMVVILCYLVGLADLVLLHDIALHCLDS
jgi:hypothetical protein